MAIPTNPILDELRQIREKLLEDAGGTLDGLVDALQEEEKKSTRLRFESRRVEEAHSTDK